MWFIFGTQSILQKALVDPSFFRFSFSDLCNCCFQLEKLPELNLSKCLTIKGMKKFRLVVI